MLGTVRIQGGDKTGNNTSGNNWLPTLQLTTGAARVMKVVAYVPSGVTQRWVCLMDSASGAPAPPDCIPLLCPPGATVTLDFADSGKLFVNGVYVVVSSTEPTSANGTITTGSNNDCKLEFEYWLKP